MGYQATEDYIQKINLRQLWTLLEEYGDDTKLITQKPDPEKE